MSNNSFEATRLALKTARQAELDHAESLDDQDLHDIAWEGVAECCDGCRVEPDGQCPHGFSSPLIILGLI
jgi:hypothetical protein